MWVDTLYVGFTFLGAVLVVFFGVALLGGLWRLGRLCSGRFCVSRWWWVTATWPLMQRAFRTTAVARVTFSLLAQRESNQREMA
jgi:hypothetical protein